MGRDGEEWVEEALYFGAGGGSVLFLGGFDSGYDGEVGGDGKEGWGGCGGEDCSWSGSFV